MLWQAFDRQKRRLVLINPKQQLLSIAHSFLITIAFFVKLFLACYECWVSHVKLSHCASVSNPFSKRSPDANSDFSTLSIALTFHIVFKLECFFPSLFCENYQSSTLTMSSIATNDRAATDTSRMNERMYELTTTHCVRWRVIDMPRIRPSSVTRSELESKLNPFVILIQCRHRSNAENSLIL